MPQLDSTWYFSQLFWLLISFIAMFIIIWKFVMPLCKATVDYRQSIFDNNLKDAEKFKAQAEVYSAEYNKCVEELNKKTQEVFAKMQEEIQATQKELENQSKKDLDNLLLENSQKIEQIKKDAESNIQKISCTLAKQMVNSIIKTSIDDNEIQLKINETLGVK